MDHALSLRPLDPAADAARLQKAIRAWRRRSKLIHFLRRALPAAVLAVLLALAVTVVVQTIGRRGQPEAAVEVRMLNPRFRSRDDEGRAFVLSAREAVRDVRDFQRILLRGPAVELQGRDGVPVKVTADSGVYLESTQVMTLTGKVRLDDPSGWVFNTERAVIDTRRDLVTGDRRVTGVGPTQSISADSFAIYNRGERILFRGRTRTQLNTR